MTPRAAGMCLRPDRMASACFASRAVRVVQRNASGEPRRPSHAACTELKLSGELHRVIESCADLIDSGALRGKDLAEALRHQGDAYFRSFRVQQASENYARALETWPDWPRALWNYGNAAYVLGDLETALRSQQRALEIDPGFAPAHNSMGAILAYRGDLRGALAEYGKAIELDPAEYHARLNRAILSHGSGRHLEALRDLDALLLADEADLNATYLHWRPGSYPNFVSVVRHERAKVLQSLDSVEEAIAELESLLAEEPEFAEAALHYSRWTVMYTDDSSRAERAVDRALQAHPDMWSLLIERARLLAIANREAAARAILADSKRFEDANVGEFFLDRAIVWRVLHENKAAEIDLISAMELDRALFDRMAGRMQELGYLMDLPGVDPRKAFANALTACSYDFFCLPL